MRSSLHSFSFDKYDVAIIGSGIAGSTLGAILARHGLKVIIFEAKSHPRFAIGESMILETSEMLRSMAEIYSVPELAYFSSENYFSHIGTSHGVKRHFSYLYHSENQYQNPAHSLQAVYYQQLRSLKLVGGGFTEFESLQNKIYTILENMNFESTEEIDRAIKSIKHLYSRVEWMPDAFAQVVEGKNHLPASKIRPAIFKRRGGFLGIGAYRQHFFGNLTMSSLIKLFLQEKAKYSALALSLKKKCYLCVSNHS